MNLKGIGEILKKKDNFLLVGHVDPDWDCTGSILALKYILKELGKHTVAGLPDTPPANYPPLKGLDELINFELQPEISGLEKGFIFIGLDSSAPDRFGPAALLAESAELVINIDHHEDNPGYGDLNYINSGRASAGMIIYDLAREMDVSTGLEFNRYIATTIIGDTGGFKHSNADREVFTLMAEMMNNGLEIFPLVRAFHTLSHTQLKLRGYAFRNLEFYSRGRIAVMFITGEELRAAGAGPEDTRNIVGYARDLEGVEVGVFIWEDEHDFQVSLRSNNYVPVNQVAARFNGGGHPRAAGCRISRRGESGGIDLREAIISLVDTIIPYLQE